jgi:hypothetical protein
MNIISDEKIMEFGMSEIKKLITEGILMCFYAG